MRLEGKICCITGAASGIGAASAKLCASQGAEVVLADIDDERGANECDDIKKAGGKASYLHLDVTSEASWKHAEEQLMNLHGCIHVMVNNAGRIMLKTVEDTSLEDWRRMLAVNLDSVFLGTQTAMRLMRAGDGGSIINISSIYGQVGESATPAYCASKGGVTLFTKSVALYCSERSYPIRCNSIHPGVVATRLGENAQNDLSDTDMTAFVKRAGESIPMRMPATADDIAQAVVYLASDESKYMTGSELVVDGGYTAH